MKYFYKKKSKKGFYQNVWDAIIFEIIDVSQKIHDSTDLPPFTE